MNAMSKSSVQTEVSKLDIWTRNEKTDPAHTKKFENRAGGFSGTSINVTYAVKRLTEEFGPAGKGWGVVVVSDEMLTGAPYFDDGQKVGNEIVHRLMIEFWWKDSEGRHSFHQFGQTVFSGRRNNGKWYSDEEAPKKSLSDAVTKAASWLGIGADIHLGRFDDQKYIADRLEEEAAKQRELEEEVMFAEMSRLLDSIRMQVVQQKAVDELTSLWTKCGPDMDRLKDYSEEFYVSARAAFSDRKAELQRTPTARTPEVTANAALAPGSSVIIPIGALSAAHEIGANSQPTEPDEAKVEPVTAEMVGASISALFASMKTEQDLELDPSIKAKLDELRQAGRLDIVERLRKEYSAKAATIKAGENS
jgi:hypothetical protein